MMEDEQIDSNGKTLRDYIQIIKRRRVIILSIFGSVFPLLIVLLYLWPPTFQSKAIILIEEQDVPQDLVATTVTSYAVQRVEEIKQKIMTNSNIIEIVERFELLSEKEIKKLTRSEIAADFRSNVSIAPISAEVIDPRSGRPTQATIAFSVSFKGKNINTVHKVTNEMVTLLLSENLKERTQQSESTAQFLGAEANALNSLLKDYEQQLATFKEQHKDSLPELSGFNMSVVERGQQELLTLQTRIQDLESRKINISAQLVLLNKSAPTILPTGETILGPVERLKALQAELSYKRTIYTEEHPQLQRIKREIRALAADGENIPGSAIAQELLDSRHKLAEALDLYSPEHPMVLNLQRQVKNLASAYASSDEIPVDIQPDNPSYILLVSQIESIDSEIASLRGKAVHLQARISEHEEYLLNSPTVEKQYLAVLRDYDNTRIKYREIKAKLMTADLAKNLEQERKGERFTLIQPPEIPEKPISPNTKMFSVLGLVVCLGLGASGGMLAESIDSQVYGEKQIIQITQLQPLIAIPYIYTERERSTTKRRLRLSFAAALMALCVALTLFHLFIKPLDVTWFILLRKFGIS